MPLASTRTMASSGSSSSGSGLRRPGLRPGAWKVTARTRRGSGAGRAGSARIAPPTEGEDRRCAPDKSKPVLITGCSTGNRPGDRREARRRTDGTSTRPRGGPTAIEDLEQGSAAKTLALDVTDEKSMSSAVEQIEEDGRPHRGAGQQRRLQPERRGGDDPDGQRRRQFETNVFGLVRMCQLVLPGHARRPAEGRIVNISSMGGSSSSRGGPLPRDQHSVEAISDALRLEVEGFGVHVVIIEPGLIATEFGETAAGSMNEVDGAPAPTRSSTRTSGR